MSTLAAIRVDVTADEEHQERSAPVDEHLKTSVRITAAARTDGKTIMARRADHRQHATCVTTETPTRSRYSLMPSANVSVT